jgi:uncharacterized protein YkwD
VEVENRDRYQDEERSPREVARRGWIVALLVGAFLLVAVNPPVSDRLGYTPPIGFSDLRPEGREHTLVWQAVSGTAGAAPQAPLYASNDPWQGWLAGERTCPGGEDRTAPATAQVDAMLCLVNFARAREGLQPLALSPTLSVSAAAKGIDIVRCQELQHGACGNVPNQVAIDVGYRGPFVENLYAAEDPMSGPRVTLDRWLNSAPQRDNLFRPDWKTIGIAVVDDASLADIDNGVVWVNQFGV